MSKRRTSQPEDVEHLLRNAQLRDQLEPFFDESLEFVNRRELPTPVENELLASMLAWERAPVLEISKWFSPELVLPQPDELGEEQLSQTLWRTVQLLFEQRIVLDFTDHLTDRQLYTLIYRDILPSPEKKIDNLSSYLHWDCSDAGGDDSVWLRYYASDQDRDLWASETHAHLPAKELPPHPRLLPREPVRLRDGALDVRRDREGLHRGAYAAPLADARGRTARRCLVRARRYDGVMPTSKRIVLTGVTRGLGLAMAGEFLARGHTVCGCGTLKGKIDELRRRWPAPHRFDVVDVSDDAAVARWASTVLAAGPPDLLINNAAVMNAPAELWKVPADEFDRLLAVNISGVTNVVRHFVPAMVARKSGVIVNFSSGWGRSVSPKVAPYCASKFAIEGLTKALAEELPDGMAAVPLNPGIINTDMLKRAWSDGANAYPSPESWAKRAVPFILAVAAKDNGHSLTVSGVPVE